MDKFFFLLIHQFAQKNQLVDGAAVLVGEYAGYVFIAALLFFIWRAHERRIHMLLSALLAVVFSRIILTEAIRALWFRPRPFAELGFSPLFEHSASSSFPSGHTALYFALAGVVFCFNKKAGTAFFTAALLIGLARVFAGVHWPSDVAGGAFLGIVSAFGAFYIVQKLLNTAKN